MKLIKPGYNILTPIDPNYILKAIEYAGRKCYKSEDKITEGIESAETLVRRLVASGHHSVLEHQSLSVEFICDRGISHELVRHRLASFSQESTRYCNYSKDKFDNQVTFVIPPWCTVQPGEYKADILGSIITNEYEVPDMDVASWIWFTAMLRAENSYIKLLEEGWLAQHARTVLPNSLKTEIVVTANIREWRTIFTQRCAPAVHPQMKEIMRPLLAELKGVLPVLFEDIHPELV